jgi:hypothetical protein
MVLVISKILYQISVRKKLFLFFSWDPSRRVDKVSLANQHVWKSLITGSASVAGLQTFRIRAVVVYIPNFDEESATTVSITDN